MEIWALIIWSKAGLPEAPLVSRHDGVVPCAVAQRCAPLRPPSPPTPQLHGGHRAAVAAVRHPNRPTAVRRDVLARRTADAKGSGAPKGGTQPPHPTQTYPAFHVLSLWQSKLIGRVQSVKAAEALAVQQHTLHVGRFSAVLVAWFGCGLAVTRSWACAITSSTTPALVPLPGAGAGVPGRRRLPRGHRRQPNRPNRNSNSNRRRNRNRLGAQQPRPRVCGHGRVLHRPGLGAVRWRMTDAFLDHAPISVHKRMSESRIPRCVSL
jgi:hypothetical protein